MAAVRHLGFVGRVFGPRTMSTWWSLVLCIIWLESFSSFDNILHVRLDKAYSRPQIVTYHQQERYDSAVDSHINVKLCRNYRRAIGRKSVGQTNRK